MTTRPHTPTLHLAHPHEMVAACTSKEISHDNATYRIETVTCRECLALIAEIQSGGADD